MGLGRRDQGARRRRCRCTSLTIVNNEQRRDRLQHPCALRVPAAQGHLRRWRSSMMYVDIACIHDRAARPAFDVVDMGTIVIAGIENIPYDRRSVCGCMYQPSFEGSRQKPCNITGESPNCAGCHAILDSNGLERVVFVSVLELFGLSKRIYTSTQYRTHGIMRPALFSR